MHNRRPPRSAAIGRVLAVFSRIMIPQAYVTDVGLAGMLARTPTMLVDTIHCKSWSQYLHGASRACDEAMAAPSRSFSSVTCETPHENFDNLYDIYLGPSPSCIGLAWRVCTGAQGTQWKAVGFQGRRPTTCAPAVAAPEAPRPCGLPLVPHGRAAPRGARWSGGRFKLPRAGQLKALPW